MYIHFRVGQSRWCLSLLIWQQLVSDIFFKIDFLVSLDSYFQGEYNLIEVSLTYYNLFPAKTCLSDTTYQIFDFKTT